MNALPLDPDALLDDVTAILTEFDREAENDFGPLSRRELLWRPAPASWSIAHCLAHLARTGAAYREVMAPQIQAARDAGTVARGPVSGGVLGRWFTKAVGPNGGMKVRAPDVFRPVEEQVEGDAVAAFRAEQGRLIELADSARGLDLDTVRTRSPVGRFVRLRVTDAFRIVAAHEARHMAQARRVRGADGFPGP